ncbi:unannotated protein [freshwater metagenome]|uniref:Unannotated protein n=1 Tax=freshwater metagenome TaxID=449393 RepID=A0A6J6EG35_9ZZZZ
MVVRVNIQTRGSASESREHLVHVHVRGGARACLVGVNGELVVVVARNDGLCGADDCFCGRGIKNSEFGVDQGCGSLYLGEGHNLGWLKSATRNREVLDRTLRLGAIEGVLGNSNLTHGVVFDPVVVRVGLWRHARFLVVSNQ